MSNQVSVTFRNEYTAQQNYTPLFPTSNKDVVVKPISDSLQGYGKRMDSSVNRILNTSTGYNIKNVIAELEKRRAEYFALACAAEDKAREAEEKRRHAEIRMERATNQLFVAELRLKEIEDERQSHLRAIEIERDKAQKAAQANLDAENRMKNAEKRVKEAENEATTLTVALTKAYQKKAEAEANARALEEKAQIIETLFLRSEAVTQTAAHVTVEGNLIFGLLIFASKSKLRAIEKAIRDIDAKYEPQAEYLSNLLQKHTAKLRPINGKAGLETEAESSSVYSSLDVDQASSAKAQKGLVSRLRFIIYGMLITQLVGMCWGFITEFLRV